MYLFSKKIKCLDCGKNFRGITERRVKRYICSGYHNYRICTRFKLNESDLYELVYNHFDITLVKQGIITGVGKKVIKPVIEPEELMERVDRVEVSAKNQTFTIYYTDGTKTLIEPNHHAYWLE